MGDQIGRNIIAASKNNFSEFPYKLISSDDIEKLGYKWFMRDNLPKHISDGIYLLNLDDSLGGGSHWTLFIIKPPYLFYYDPFGAGLMSGYSPKEINEYAKTHGLQVIESEFWQQHPKSYMCGYNCLYIADVMKKYYNHLTPNLFKQILYKEFGNSADKSDIEKIMKWATLNNLI